MAEEPDAAPQPILERKLVTILSADVAEYSRLMAEDEEHTLKVFREYSAIFSALVESHHGRIFNTAGDAILAEFTSPVEAVRCATDIQAALRTRNDLLPPARQVRFRIGVNLGDVMMQKSDLMGDGVNVAARLQSAAEPGGITLSGSVYDQIRNKLSLSFESLGERRYKNIPQPVRTFAIAGTDGHAPVAKPADKKTGGLVMAGVAAAAVLLLAGGYWAMQQRANQSSVTVTAPPARPAVAQPAAKPANVPANDAAKPAASVPESQSTAAAPDTARAERPQRKIQAAADSDAAAGSQDDPDNSVPSAIFDEIAETKAADSACWNATKADPNAASSDVCGRRDKLVEDLKSKGWCGKPRGDTGVLVIWNECP